MNSVFAYINTNVLLEETEGGPVTSLPASETKKARVVVTRADQESEIRVGASGVAARQPETVYEVFENAVSRCPDVHALCVKRQGEWVKWTYKEYMEDVKRAAKSLITVSVWKYLESRAGTRERHVR